jgi:hypothetical protein
MNQTETHKPSGAEVLQAIIGQAKQRPSLLYLGEYHAQYELLFWRPFLGQPAYAFYRTLLAFAACPWMEPTIETMAAAMGQGDRYTILGRRSPSQEGAAARLVKLGIVDHLRRGNGRQTSHVWHTLPLLPVLTPEQAGKLARPGDHEWFLGGLPGFDLPKWRGDKRPSLVAEAVAKYGRVKIGK